MEPRRASLWPCVQTASESTAAEQRQTPRWGASRLSRSLISSVQRKKRKRPGFTSDTAHLQFSLITWWERPSQTAKWCEGGVFLKITARLTLCTKATIGKIPRTYVILYTVSEKKQRAYLSHTQMKGLKDFKKYPLQKSMCHVWTVPKTDKAGELSLHINLFYHACLTYQL